MEPMEPNSYIYIYKKNIYIYNKVNRFQTGSRGSIIKS